MTQKIHCPAIKAPCEHYSCVEDRSGEVPITYCSHPLNKVLTEGNTVETLCPRLYVKLKLTRAELVLIYDWAVGALFESDEWSNEKGELLKKIRRELKV